MTAPIMESPDHPTESQSLGGELKELWRKNLAFFKKLISLREGLDREGTIANIRNNKRMQGANAWLLMCSIMIASLGLDLDSQAIIIGAMLISPLMSPILGIGLGIGTNDRQMLLVSFRHFSIAFAIAVITSTFYFFFTPIGNVTDEILRRTEPTFLDVLVAFFGGIAGIISGSQKDKSSALPGVAIATALMPPLCVTGFGIATWLKISIGWADGTNFSAGPFIINSFYLFHLNAFFVAFATFIIVRHLRFPLRAYDNRKRKRRTQLIISMISLLLALPSFYLMGSVITKAQDERSKEQFIGRYFKDDAKYIDESLLVNVGDRKKLIIKVYGTNYLQENIAEYQAGLKECGLEDTDLEIIPTTEIDLNSFRSLQAQVKGINTELEDRIKEAQQNEIQRNAKINSLTQKLDSIQLHEKFHADLESQIDIFIDDIDHISSRTQHNQDSIEEVSVNIFWSSAKSSRTKEVDRKKIAAYLRQLRPSAQIKIIDK